MLKLVDATRKISSGNLSTQVTGINGIKEINELANSFNSMARSLKTRSNELEKASKELNEAYIEADEKNRSLILMKIKTACHLLCSA